MSRVWAQFMRDLNDLEEENIRLRNDLEKAHKENCELRRQWEQQQALVQQYQMRWILSMPEGSREDPLTQKADTLSQPKKKKRSTR